MKIKLTKEQSARLIELGVPREKASGINIDNFDNMVLLAAEAIANGNRDKTIRSLSSPIFKLIDLLEILPKEIEYEEISSELCIWFNITYQKWDVGYTYDLGFWKDTRFRHTEPIDALYELLCWVIENGYLKFD